MHHTSYIQTAFSLDVFLFPVYDSRLKNERPNTDVEGVVDQ